MTDSKIRAKEAIDSWIAMDNERRGTLLGLRTTVHGMPFALIFRTTLIIQTSSANASRDIVGMERIAMVRVHSKTMASG